MKKKLLSLMILFCGSQFIAAATPPQKYTSVERQAAIYPDYTSIIIPPNIAPMNFMIQEEGDRFLVQLRGQDQALTVLSKNDKICFPASDWKKFLQRQIGRNCSINIFVRKQGQWFKYADAEMTIADAPIDEALVYRLINPAYHIWAEMGIYQRNLTNFKQKLIFSNRSVEKGCINCHSFRQNDPQSMMLHLRGGPGTALLLAENGEIKNINTRTNFNPSPGAYRCWHPNGRYIAFSANKVTQFFHAYGENRDVYDLSSDLILYDIETNTVSSCPQIADVKEMETYPMWTPDGRTLYFCSAPQPDFSDELNLPYDKIMYSLKRIAFSPEEKTWGRVETVIDAQVAGLSVTHPSVSPDGRFLLFCMSGYGNFTIYKRDSDLYLMDLRTGEYHLLPINSNKADSYHSWSSNSRWFVFSSKRDNGIVARPYFAYIDHDGNVGKPFIMPQEDPSFYLTFLKTYNVPELVKSEVKINSRQWTKAAHQKSTNAALDPVLSTSAKPSEPEVTPWQPAPQ
jgi:hypothetical protein